MSFWFPGADGTRLMMSHPALMHQHANTDRVATIRHSQHS
ncbi:hypothetical protein ASAP_2001 [Asaia bogorensis]|uniref:Uncharacterized protein n=1 Tax=Asaia bogorensis TaxID=91915 RepID=A0A060QKM9_9PROT|nr:hypothetical protein ASAP_2001 [Asaia bogorensis]